jgi:hypothetical protein
LRVGLLVPLHKFEDTFKSWYQMGKNQVARALAKSTDWIEPLVSSMQDVQHVDVQLTIHATNYSTYPLTFDHVKDVMAGGLPINDHYAINISKLWNLRINILLVQKLEDELKSEAEEDVVGATRWLHWSRQTGILQDVFDVDTAPSTDMPEVMRHGLQGMDTDDAWEKVYQITRREDGQ